MNTILQILGIFACITLQSQELFHSNIIYYRAGMHTPEGQHPKHFTYKAMVYPNLPNPIINVINYKTSENNPARFGSEIQPQIARNLSLYFIHHHPQIQKFTLNILDYRGFVITKKNSIEDCMINERSVHSFDAKNNNWRGICDARDFSYIDSNKRKFSLI